MASAGTLVRLSVAVLGLGATALGLMNTYGDYPEVQALAERTACGREGCSFQKLREEHSALSRQFTFQVSLAERGRTRAATADVECRRAYVLLGTFSCRLASGGLPSPSD